MNPIISIIVPVYNTRRELSRCLKSLLLQTLREIEVICIDDGSTDGSTEVLRRYACRDDRIVALFGENHGVEAARAEAIRHAKGEFLMFCDSDDSLMPDACRTLVEVSRADKVDWVMCGTRCRGAFTEFERNSYRFKSVSQAPSRETIPGYVLWNKIYRRTILERSGLFFPETPLIRRGFDAYFVLLYAMVAKTVSVIPDSLVIHYRRRGSLQDRVKTNRLPKAFDAIQAIPYGLDFLDRNGLYASFSHRFFQFVDMQVSSTVCNGSPESFDNAVSLVRSLLAGRKDDIGEDLHWLNALLHRGVAGENEFREWARKQHEIIRKCERERWRLWYLSPLRRAKEIARRGVRFCLRGIRGGQRRANMPKG